MIDVLLVSKEDVSPIKMARYAASCCYQPELPDLEKFKGSLNVKKKLVGVGHHTTLEHQNFSFYINGIGISAITLGLHLVHKPQHTSSQRSGRFCSDMFSSPNFKGILGYIKFFWPEIDPSALDEIMDYITTGYRIYQENIGRGTGIAKKIIREERPNAGEEYVEANGSKFAQEQMRMVIPTILPTGIVFSTNLISLWSMFNTAWLPDIKFVLGEMIELVKREHSETKKIFLEMGEDTSKIIAEHNDNFLKELVADLKIGEGTIRYKPELELMACGFRNMIIPDGKLRHPFNLTPYIPSFMDNETRKVACQIIVSLATMGQDQRHRTIDRGIPRFTGDFYIPPIMKEMGIEQEIERFFTKWVALKGIIPASLLVEIAPYGAMVSYRKTGGGNAIAHEMGKRTCFCAGEEIYHLSKSFLEWLDGDWIGSDGINSFLNCLSPKCITSGVCAEGKRCCGRDMCLIKKNPFPDRRV